MNKLTPVENYNPPALPTLAEKPNLCELPKRWAKNAAVVACIGVLGMSTLFSTHAAAASAQPNVPCAQEYSVLSARSEYAVELRGMHGGGFGSAFYVVHLTEQEMYHIVRTELEAAGLRLNSPPPLVTQNRLANAIAGFGMGVELPVVRINMFDMRRRVGVALVPWGGSELAQITTRRFARNPALTLTEVGVFYNVNSRLDRPQDMPEAVWPPTSAQLQEIGAQQAAALRRQTQDFITILQQRGRIR